MTAIERFWAADSERRMGVVAFAGGGLFVCGLALWLWRGPWMAPWLVGGLLFIVCGYAQELGRWRWGTIGLIAACLLGAAGPLLPMVAGHEPWRASWLIGPAIVLAGAALFWWRRPRSGDPYVVPGDVRRAIGRLERALGNTAGRTPFHAVLGRDFLEQADAAADWLAAVYDAAAEQDDVTALGVELERIEINTDAWTVHAAAFAQPPSELFEDLDCQLAESQYEHEDVFVLGGMEDVQAAYARTDLGDLMVSDRPEDQTALQAAALASDLITARMQELVAAAHRQVRRRKHPLGRVRVFAYAHDSFWPPVCSPPR